MEADKGSLEPSPNPALFMNEPQEESGGQASPETCSSERVMDLDEYSQSSREQEVMGRDTTWKGTFEPSLLITYQIINIDMRRSWYPRSHKNPSSNTKSVATYPEDVYFDELLEVCSKVTNLYRSKGYLTSDVNIKCMLHSTQTINNQRFNY